MHRRSARPRGAILAAALVCLLIVVLFTGAVARSMIMCHRAMRWDERQAQCFWLAESAAARAIAQCRADPDYAGESWRVTLSAAANPTAGVAIIRVESVPGELEQRRILVEARWPDEPFERVVRNKELIIHLGGAKQ